MSLYSFSYPTRLILRKSLEALGDLLPSFASIVRISFRLSSFAWCSHLVLLPPHRVWCRVLQPVALAFENPWSTIVRARARLVRCSTTHFGILVSIHFSVRMSDLWLCLRSFLARSVALNWQSNWQSRLQAASAGLLWSSDLQAPKSYKL